MVPNRSLLVVDSLAETPEVLRTALGSRGIHVLCARRAEEGVQLARQMQPDLIVLDMEVASTGPHGAQQVADTAAAQNTPVVLLGVMRRGADSPSGGGSLAKPYHYQALIRKIESLLQCTADSASTPAAAGNGHPAGHGS